MAADIEACTYKDKQTPLHFAANEWRCLGSEDVTAEWGGHRCTRL